MSKKNFTYVLECFFQFFWGLNTLIVFCITRLVFLFLMYLTYGAYFRDLQKSRWHSQKGRERTPQNPRTHKNIRKTSMLCDRYFWYSHFTRHSHTWLAFRAVVLRQCGASHLEIEVRSRRRWAGNISVCCGRVLIKCTWLRRNELLYCIRTGWLFVADGSKR